MSDAVVLRGEKVVVDFVLGVEAANVGVVNLMCCFVVDVVHVVCSHGVSSLVVNCAEFCVCANVHCVCVRANLLVLFQHVVSCCGGCREAVGLWRRVSGGWVGMVNISERLEGSLPVVVSLLTSPSAVWRREGAGGWRQWGRRVAVMEGDPTSSQAADKPSR